MSRLGQQNPLDPGIFLWIKRPDDMFKFLIDPITPHRRNRQRETQDRRPLRQAKRRWKVKWAFAWVQNFRRLVVCYDYHDVNFLGFV